MAPQVRLLHADLYFFYSEAFKILRFRAFFAKGVWCGINYNIKRLEMI